MDKRMITRNQNLNQSRKDRNRQRGSSMVELAIILPLIFLMLLGFLAFISLSRTRTAATAAAFACAQFLSQNPDPAQARDIAYSAAMGTLKGGWSGTAFSDYSITVQPPGGQGQPGTCRVAWRVRSRLIPWTSDWSAAMFISRSETWKAKWH
jgi:Flp pilus assembly protein TadG